ncbi:hypothetical protein [Paraburkholderia rhynchosiae]|uniref:Uncharacterized protein n=1 Tax=Paraburkholderia rhynchosiae TaxID=487049 RepID=A0A2N7WVE9_9BURK|nr:hypothetical protein [Paraburkholderia rhynchosiae]PMS33456.1 hypothetical protein C0Z16_02395 [Paraburkholderia rhynchosiae]CAB3681982.1 hypothetical protein LMG27174_02715 [Paraburkholderia rhynchosiae]
MMWFFAKSVEMKRTYDNAIVVIGVVAFVAVCATGIAALAGLLPESENVAAAVTATPLVDLQTELRQTISNP